MGNKPPDWAVSKYESTEPVTSFLAPPANQGLASRSSDGGAIKAEDGGTGEGVR